MFVLLLQNLIDEQETGPGAEALSRACVRKTSINQPLAGLLHFACLSVLKRKGHQLGSGSACH